VSATIPFWEESCARLLGKGISVNAPYNGIDASQLHEAVWRKSRCSNPNGNIVELAALPGGSVAVRNSRYQAGPALIYSRAEIAAFVTSVKSGEFDALAG